MCSKKGEVRGSIRTICSLWNEAQGKPPWHWDDNWPKRCDLCGRRIEFGDFVSVFVGQTDTAVVIHAICYQHGGQHVDCLKGIKVDFGRGKRWPIIWASNLLDELIIWIESVVRFARLVLTLLLHVVMHPRHYHRYRQRMRKWGMDGGS